MTKQAELRALEVELRRQDEVLAGLRDVAEANGDVQLQLGDEIRQRIGALVEQMNVRSASPAPIHGIAV